MNSKVKLSFRKPASMLAICASLMMPVNSQAGIEKDMANMFNSMGVGTQVTEAGAFHGQTGSLYTGGSLSMRAPVSDVSLLNIQLPSVTAGCGGIDFFGGAFSFANKEQFIQFTRNLGNNAAGVAFDLALKALDPMIQDAIGGIRDLVNRVNNANLNSCEAAKQIVGGAAGMLGSAINQNCRASAVQTGRAEDGSHSNWLCTYSNNLVAEADKMRNKNTPQDTISFTGGNLTYEAIKRAYGEPSQDDMNFYIALMGTAVFFPPKEINEEKVQAGSRIFPPKITSAEQLLKGKYGNEHHARYITIDLWECVDGEKRLKENCSEKRDQRIPSIRYNINQALQMMVNNIRRNSAWSMGDFNTAVKVVNNSSMPVLKMAVSDAYLGTSNLSKDAVIDAIAIDFVAHILSKNERLMRSALGFYHKTDEVADQKANQLFQNLSELRKQIFEERREALKLVEIEQNLMQAMAANDSLWRAQFSETGSALEFDQANRL